jgi:hypothetical protein
MVKIWWILLMFWCLVSEFSMVFRVPVQNLLRLYQPTWGDLSNFTWVVQKGVNVSKKCGLKRDERGHIFGFWPTNMGIAATNMGRSDNVTNTLGLARWMGSPRNIIFHLVKTTAGKSAKTRRILVASPIPDEGNQEHPRKFDSKNHFWSSCRGFSSNIWVERNSTGLPEDPWQIRQERLQIRSPNIALGRMSRRPGQRMDGLIRVSRHFAALDWGTCWQQGICCPIWKSWRWVSCGCCGCGGRPNFQGVWGRTQT